MATLTVAKKLVTTIFDSKLNNSLKFLLTSLAGLGYILYKLPTVQQELLQDLGDSSAPKSSVVEVGTTNCTLTPGLQIVMILVHLIGFVSIPVVMKTIYEVYLIANAPKSAIFSVLLSLSMIMVTIMLDISNDSSNCWSLVPLSTNYDILDFLYYFFLLTAYALICLSFEIYTDKWSSTNYVFMGLFLVMSIIYPRGIQIQAETILYKIPVIISYIVIYMVFIRMGAVIVSDTRFYYAPLLGIGCYFGGYVILHVYDTAKNPNIIANVFAHIMKDVGGIFLAVALTAYFMFDKVIVESGKSSQNWGRLPETGAKEERRGGDDMIPDNDEGTPLVGQPSNA